MKTPFKRPRNPASGSATASPRSSANWRSSSSCSSVRSVGVSTTHGHEQVAAAATLEVGHAAVAEAEHPAGLGARRGRRSSSSPSRVSSGSVVPSAAWAIEIGGAVQQVVALAVEALVAGDPEVHVEVAGRRRGGRPRPDR